MARPVDFSRQIAAILNLTLPPRMVGGLPRPGAEVTKFEVEDWATTDHVFVAREYCPGSHAPSIRYVEGYKIGPRGAVTQVYSHTNI